MTGKRAARRVISLVLMMATLTATAGCGGDGHVDDKRPAAEPSTVAKPQLEVRVRTFAAEAVTDLAPLPPETGITSVPCDDPVKDLAEDGRYYLSGAWQVPLPTTDHRTALQRLRTAWQARGYQIKEYRELPDGVKVVMSAQDPATGMQISITSTQPPTAVSLLVTSPCVMSPDGRFPA